jgi:site-specific DNA recombinase
MFYHRPAERSWRVAGRKQTVDGPKRAVIYARISQDRGGEAVGVKRQLRDCMKLVTEKGYTLAADPFIDNNVSAYSGKPRPAYKAMADLIESDGVGALVVWHIDRLYRSPRELEDLIDLVGGSGLVVDPVNRDSTIDLSDTDGQLVARMVVAVARKSSDDTRRRIVRWHEDRVERGLPHGGGRRPYGYDWDTSKGTWKIRLDEAKVVRRIARDLLNGRSLSSIVRYLNLEGIPTANGKGRWANGTVSRLVKTPTIAGLRVHKRSGTTTKGNWKGIITPNQRELLLALFNDPMRPKRGGGPTNRKRLLSGLLVCARCGSKMYGDGPRAYACHKSWKGCGNVRIASAPLEDWVTWEAVQHLKRLFQAGRVVEHDTEEEDSQPLIEERLGLQQRRDEWAQKLALGAVDDHAYAVGVKAIDARLDELQAALAATVRQSVAPIEDDDIDFVIAPRVGQNWTAMLSPKELLDRYELITQLIDKVIVSPASRRGARWEPERLEIVWSHADV